MNERTKKILEKNPSRRCYRVDPGNSWNPLKHYPKNATCWCSSGIKAKRCCLPTTPQFVSVKQAATLAQFVKYVEAGGTERLKIQEFNAPLPEAREYDASSPPDIESRDVSPAHS
jgi:hypothetical protein